MRLVIQRVTKATITIDHQIEKSIANGLVVLLGITQDDTVEDIDWLIKKVLQLRIFNDRDGKMNDSVTDINGDLLVVSQFTLFASTKKGNRPSYIHAAKPEIAIPLYNSFVSRLRASTALKVETGSFGAHMDISLINNGPVTILIDSKERW